MSNVASIKVNKDSSLGWSHVRREIDGGGPGGRNIQVTPTPLHERTDRLQSHAEPFCGRTERAIERGSFFAYQPYTGLPLGAALPDSSGAM